MNDNETQIEILNKKVEKLELEINQIKQSFEPSKMLPVRTVNGSLQPRSLQR